jgi:hypothetical protein
MRIADTHRCRYLLSIDQTQRSSRPAGDPNRVFGVSVGRVTDLSLERGREVCFAGDGENQVRVRLQPGWALAPGTRLATRTRSLWARTQTPDTATIGVGLVGSALGGVAWLVLVAMRWTAYHLRRRRDWTVTVSAYEDVPMRLTGRREPVTERAVRSLEVSQHSDYSAALTAAKASAAALVQDGFRRVRYPS